MTAMNFQQAFDLGMSHHDSGRLQQAEAIYRQILQTFPDHPDVLHRLGILASQVGRNDMAVDLVRRAINIYPNGAEYYGNLGLFLCALDRTDDGIAAYEKALELKPDYPEALSNLGNAYRIKARSKEAAELCRKAIKLRPTFAEAYNNLGNALLDQKKIDGAIANYRKALELNPKFAEAHNNLGGALQDREQFEESMKCYERALAVRPDYTDALNNLANALGKLDRRTEGIASVRKALKINPDFPEALNTLTNLLTETHQNEEALITGRRAVELRPHYPEAHNNVGNALYELDRIEEAIAEYRISLEQRPSYFQAHNNLGNSLHALGELKEAEISCREAVRIDPQFPAAHWNLALVLLLQGKYSEGWAEYEWRWKVKELRPPRIVLPHAEWSGQDLRGKRLMLYVEQGFGDTIQFIRFIPKVAERGARVMVIVQPELFRLLKDFPGPERIFPSEGAPLPTDFDFHYPLLSVPRMLDLTQETIPRDVPYIHPDPADVEKWRARVPSDGRLKIGIAWAGRPSHANDRKRSSKLATFAPLAEIKNTWFCSLQKGNRSAESANPPPGMELADWTTELKDFADTAALIANLDLVISVDTSIVHVAAAMGKPVWMLLPAMPDWRWMLHRSDSPWYPTVRLFRQPKLWDYQTPMQEIVQALQCRMQSQT